ncbi:MAG: hypothetical protein D3910_21355 [Candidatus Electrothrix sp. ATG2]|nr:hypothetical protein [Candidatus Electrothrix sp. ATG2]
MTRFRTPKATVQPAKTFSLEEKKEHVRQTFASISQRYDFLNSLLSLLLDRCWRRRTTRLLRDFPEGPILDLCAGTLPLSQELAHQARNRRIFSLDSTNEIIISACNP